MRDLKRMKDLRHLEMRASFAPLIREICISQRLGSVCRYPRPAKRGEGRVRGAIWSLNTVWPPHLAQSAFLSPQSGERFEECSLPLIVSIISENALDCFGRLRLPCNDNYEAYANLQYAQ